MLQSVLFRMVKQLALCYSVSYWYSATLSWWQWKSVKKNFQLLWHIGHTVPTLLAAIKYFGDG